MAERERIDEPDKGGAKIYDAAEGAEAALRKPLVEDDRPGDGATPRSDPNLGNILTIIVVAVLVIAVVFGTLILLNVF